MLNKIKNMSRKEKMEYIWDYYKIHILVAIFIIIAVVYTVYSNATKTEYVFNLTVIGSGIDLDKKGNLEDKLTKVVIPKPEERKQAYVDFIPLGNSKDGDNAEKAMEPYVMQKFSAKLAAGEMDILIVDEESFEKFVMQGMFERLDSFKELDLSDKNAVKIENGSEDVKPGIYGVRVKGNTALKDIGYNTENKVVGIISNSKNKDKGATVIKWLQENSKSN